MCSVRALLVSAWVPFSIPGSSHLRIHACGLISDSQLPVGMNVRMNDCLKWRLVQAVHQCGDQPGMNHEP